MSSPSTTILAASARPAPRVDRRREHLFFSGIAIVLTLTVFAGFAPTYYLHGPLESTFVLTTALKLHGAAFTAWMLLLIAQTSLVAAGRTDVHRRLGVAGGVLALAMMVLGAYVAISRTRLGLTLSPVGMTQLSFMAVPLVSAVVFPVLIGAALWYRGRSDFHKRLMLIATIEIATAGVGRLPGMNVPVGSFGPLGPLGFFGTTDLFLVALVVYDLATLKRLHPATLWGGVFLLASQPLRLLITQTSTWTAVATWLTT